MFRIREFEEFTVKLEVGEVEVPVGADEMGGVKARAKAACLSHGSLEFFLIFMLFGLRVEDGGKGREDLHMQSSSPFM